MGIKHLIFGASKKKEVPLYDYEDLVIIYGAQYSPTYGAAVHAFDNNPAGSWFPFTGDSNNTWLGCIFPEPAPINGVYVVGAGSWSCQEYRVEYSVDNGATWQTALHVNNTEFWREELNLTFPSITASHWRFRTIRSQNLANKEIAKIRFETGY